MSSIRKPIKIIKHNATEPSTVQPQVLKAIKQSRREMAKVVVSWIEERRQAHSNLGVRWPGTAL
ncbi:MAG TPA: hypothetical protein VLB68_19440 [Pyrinomonadaceae bacterium]|nr:hypothetical protein [Pyrinomonadaceae bacterium]